MAELLDNIKTKDIDKEKIIIPTNEDQLDVTKTKIEDIDKEIITIIPSNNNNEDLLDDLETIMAKLHKVKDPVLNRYHYLHQGFWVPEFAIRGVISFQRSFVARDDDIVLASCPKSGTTWLKALSFAIVRRTKFSLSDNPLLSSNPHDLVPLNLGHNIDTNIEPSDLENNTSPRLFSTHITFSSLPSSIMSSKAKIVYISRNPLDLFVSLWHFGPKVFGKDVEPSRLAESFERFCLGSHAYGPFWDHILGFWKASLEYPNKVLFLKYEDLKKDGSVWVKKIADFLGYPFSKEEEDLGVVEEILKLCSIENMKSLDVNINGKRPVIGLSHSAFFRKGNVGDWVNYLTPRMAEKGKNIVAEKFKGSGLTFEFEFHEKKA